MTISKLSTNASLKEVMDKFEEISLQDFSDVDIIARNELPSKVKEGQIVIITQNTTGKIYVSLNNEGINLNNNDILLQADTNNENRKSLYCGNKEIRLSYKSCVQNDNYLESFYGENGKWVQITFIKKSLLENGVVQQGGSFVRTYGVNNDTMLSNGNLNLKVRNGQGCIGYNKAIDYKGHTKLVIKISSMRLPTKNKSDVASSNYIDFGLANDMSGVNATFYAKQLYQNNTTSTQVFTNTTVEIDVSKINPPSDVYFVLRADYGTNTDSFNEIHISDIYLV